MVTAKLLSKYDCALVAALDFFARVRDTRNYFEKGENNFSKDYTVTIKNIRDVREIPTAYSSLVNMIHNVKKIDVNKK